MYRPKNLLNISLYQLNETTKQEIEAKINDINKKVGDEPSPSVAKLQTDQMQELLKEKMNEKQAKLTEKNLKARADSERRFAESALKRQYFV